MEGALGARIESLVGHLAAPECGVERSRGRLVGRGAGIDQTAERNGPQMGDAGMFRCFDRLSGVLSDLSPTASSDDR